MFDFLNPQMPKTLEHTKLMLLGAMYVEENGILAGIDENVSDDISREELLDLLKEGYGALDMNMDDYPAPEEMEEMLSESWGIRSKEDFFRKLDWLLKDGDHKQLKQLISFAKTYPAQAERTLGKYRERFGEPLAFEECEENDFLNLIGMAEHVEPTLSPSGVFAWDVARYVHLLRLAYLADFIKEKEAWKLLEHLKAPVVATFRNWDDFAHSYMIGRKLWSGSASVLDDACQRLLKHPRSPWVVMGWIGS